MNDKRIWGISAGLMFVVAVVACAEGTAFDPQSSSSTGKGDGGGGGAYGSSSNGGGGNSTSGSGGMGIGGMASNSGGSGGASNSGGNGGGGGNSSSSSSSSSGATCPGVIVDWNWNTGTGPTNLTFGGTSWSIGASNSVGPKDGLTYLATVPDGYYANNRNDWAQLPKIDLSPYQTCRFRTTVAVWRSTENDNFSCYDGGNIQFTTDPAGMTGWKILDNADLTMAYDTKLSNCGNGCIVEDQWTWCSTYSPKSRLGIYEDVMPGTSVTFRFTFRSDGNNNISGPVPGLYVKSLLVEVF